MMAKGDGVSWARQWSGWSGWVLWAWGLCAVAAVAPLEEMRAFDRAVKRWGQVGGEQERQARLHATVVALLEEGRPVATYGGAGAGESDSWRTSVLDYVMLPHASLEHVPPPVGEELDGVEVLLGLRDHPEASSAGFRENFPHRRRAYGTRLYARDELPEPCAVVQGGFTSWFGGWSGSWRVVWAPVWGGLAMLAALWLPGRWVGMRVGMPGGAVRRMLGAWALGAGLAMALFPLLGWAFGMRMEWLAFLLAGCGAGAWWWDAQRRSMGGGAALTGMGAAESWRWAPLACAALVLAVGLASAVAFPMHASAPAVCNWAYKTKLLAGYGTWPTGWFDVYDGTNRQAHYPPGFAVVGAWFHTGAGRVADHAVRLLPALLLAACCGLCVACAAARRGWHAGMAGLALLCVACFVNPASVMLAQYFYAEPLLALFVCLALADVTGRRHASGVGGSFWLLLAGAAWVKPEGVALFALAAVALPFLAWKGGGGWRGAWCQARWAGAVGMLAVAPWWAYVALAGGLGGEGGGAMDWGRLAALWPEVGRQLWPGWRDGSLVGWVLVPALAMALMRRDWRSGLCLFLAGGLVLGACAQMVFSSVSLEMYFQVFPRIFWLPAVVALFACFPPPEFTSASSKP